MKRLFCFIGLCISICLCLIVSGFSLAILLVILATFIGISLECIGQNKQDVILGKKVMYITFAVYLFSAVIVSSLFGANKYFLAVDPTSYFQLLNMKTLDQSPFMYFLTCYGLLSDNNELHELFVRLCIIFANNYLDGASVLYLTLINVFFGVLSIGVVYRIIRLYLSSEKAYKYALVFALLSPFHFYSVCFVRDIIIAFFYAHAIEIILKDFKIRNLIILILMALLVWGIRLYSGLFMLSFIFFYMYKIVGKTKVGRRITIIFGIAFGAYLLPKAISSEIYQQATVEMQYYTEFSQERTTSSSLSGIFDRLPTGIREITQSLFSQIMPFPFYAPYKEITSLERFYMASLMALFEIYWYFIAFGLLFFLIVYKGYKALAFEDWILLTICVAFILLNISQIDIRRIMAIYPLMLLIYARMSQGVVTPKRQIACRRNLTIVYIGMLIVYNVIKIL